MSLPPTIEDLRALPPVVLEQYAALSPLTVIGTAEGVSPQQIIDAVNDYLTDHPASTGHVHIQSIPLSSWVITHPLGRIPNVAVYLDGVAVDADVTASATTATITFPSPAAGTAVFS